jgi:hypothetical protein
MADHLKGLFVLILGDIIGLRDREPAPLASPAARKGSLGEPGVRSFLKNEQKGKKWQILRQTLMLS